MSFQVIVNQTASWPSSTSRPGPAHAACPLRQRVSLVHGSMSEFPQGVRLHAAVTDPQHCLPEVMLGDMLSGVLRMSARPCSTSQQQTCASAHVSQLYPTNSGCPTASSQLARKVSQALLPCFRSACSARSCVGCCRTYRQHETPVGNRPCARCTSPISAVSIKHAVKSRRCHYNRTRWTVPKVDCWITASVPHPKSASSWGLLVN